MTQPPYPPQGGNQGGNEPGGDQERPAAPGEGQPADSEHPTLQFGQPPVPQEGGREQTQEFPQPGLSGEGRAGGPADPAGRAGRCPRAVRSAAAPGRRPPAEPARSRRRTASAPRRSRYGGRAPVGRAGRSAGTPASRPTASRRQDDEPGATASGRSGGSPSTGSSASTASAHTALYAAQRPAAAGQPALRAYKLVWRPRSRRARGIGVAIWLLLSGDDDPTPAADSTSATSETTTSSSSSAETTTSSSAETTTTAEESTTAPAGIPPATESPDGLGDDSTTQRVRPAVLRREHGGLRQPVHRVGGRVGLQEYADTCAGRQPAESGQYCTIAFPGS